MGSLHRYKGVDIFLRSLSGVNGDFRAVVAGSFKGGHEIEELLQRSQLRQDLISRVTFTGAVTREELRSLYHLADIFVYPTSGDTLPLVVLEAMACGKPVISSAIAGLPFAVGGGTGILVPPGDPAAVARATNTLLQDEDARKEMGAAARARVVQKFRWSQSAKAAVEGYRAVLREKERAVTARDSRTCVAGDMAAFEKGEALK